MRVGAIHLADIKFGDLTKTQVDRWTSQGLLKIRTLDLLKIVLVVTLVWRLK